MNQTPLGVSLVEQVKLWHCSRSQAVEGCLMTLSCLVSHALYVGSYCATPPDLTAGGHQQAMAETHRRVPLELGYAYWVLAGRGVPE